MSVLAGKLEPDGSRIMLAWGKVSKDAKLTYTKTKNIPKVSTSVCVDKNEYINIMTLGDSAVGRTASCLEYGDYIFCMGKFRKTKYINKKGIEKEWAELQCDVILVQTDIKAQPQQTTAEVPQIVDDGPPDAFESADDNYTYDFELSI